MNKIKAIIIEDEIPAARLLFSMIKKVRPNWDLEILPGSVDEAVHWFENNDEPQLIFLDIQLSDGNSFEFLEQVRPNAHIIFTTAYDEFAIRAFTVNSIDYILKPVSEERLDEAIRKFESMYEKINTNQLYLSNVFEALRAPAKKYRTRFLISGADKLWTLQVSEIAYFYTENKITFATTFQGTEHIIDLSLDKLMEQLDPDRFFRANRQFIISVESIKKIEPYFNSKVVVIVSPRSKEKITISKEKISTFKLWLNY